MEGINLNNNLVKKSYSILSNKYATESGKKFVLHLISAFIPVEEKAEIITLRNRPEDELKCCICKCNIVPADVQFDTNPRKVIVDYKLKLIPRSNYYGYRSELSTKIISEEGLEALKRFVDSRIEAGDDVISKIQKYLDKNKNNTVNERTLSFKNKVSKLKEPSKSKAEITEDVDLIPNRPSEL